MLTLVTGPPSVGKTTFCRSLGRPWIDIDHWSRRRFRLPKVPAIDEFWEDHDWHWVDFAEEIIDRKIEYVADCLPTAKLRAKYPKTFGPMNVICLWADLPTLLRRNQGREDPISEKALLDKYADFQIPTQQEGFVAIYLKKMNDGTVMAIGDAETLKAYGGTYDMVVGDEDFANAGCKARLNANGEIVLGYTDQEIYDMRAAKIRARRDHKLLRVDRLSPIRWELMSDEEKDVWRQYRQDLLDITVKDGFPWDGENVPWPDKPDQPKEG